MSKPFKSERTALWLGGMQNVPPPDAPKLIASSSSSTLTRIDPSVRQPAFIVGGS